MVVKKLNLRYVMITTLFLFMTLTTTQVFGIEFTELNDSSQRLIEKHLPTDIKVKIADFCIRLGDGTASKETRGIWSTLHINLLSLTPEFQSLDGKLGSITVKSENKTISLSCPPPKMSLTGTFTSVNGKEHEYYLEYNSTTFKYQIDEITSSQYVDYESPIKQFKAWSKLDIIQKNPELLMDVIQCKQGFDLVIKSSNGHPACVKPETKQKLIERGWAKPL